MKPIMKPAAAICVLVALASSSSAEPARLSLHEAVGEALERNPRIVAALSDVAGASERVGVARASYLPSLSARAGYRRFESHAFLPEGLGGQDVPDTIGPTDDFSAGIEARYTVFDGGKRRAGLDASEALRGAAKDGAETVRAAVVLETHQAFYGLLAALEALSVAERGVERTEAHLASAEARAAVGDVARSDVLRAQVERADARLALVRAQDDVRVARGRLNTVLGRAVDAPVDPVDELARSPADEALAELLRRGVARRPEVAASEARARVGEAGVDAARSAFWPRLEVQAGYGWRDDAWFPGDEDWRVGAAIELPLFAGGSRKHQLAAARAERDRARVESEGVLHQVREQVWRAHSRLQEAREEVAQTRTLVEDARESERAARARYAVGAGTLSDLLDTNTALARAEARDVAARFALRLAAAELRWATGQEIHDPGTAGIGEEAEP